MRRKIIRRCAIVIICLALLTTMAGLWIWSRLHASLPSLDGRQTVSGLKAAVKVERDDIGVPTIYASNRIDAAWATGFLHGQDRFFQMDLLRRVAAGELAELAGPAAVFRDRERRFYRCRALARQVVQDLSAEQRALVEAYVGGVNQGLHALGSKPPEYYLLRCDPAVWRDEDTVLVVYAMFFELQDFTGHAELEQDAMCRALPREAFNFFAPIATEWDAPVDDSVLTLPSIPTREQFVVTNVTCKEQTKGPISRHRSGGSNGWAVDGTVSRNGAALVANDMHLGMNLPNIWYRLRLRVGSDFDLCGITLPGVPFLVVGSNRHIAWAFTNSKLDTTDVIPLELSPQDPALYRTPDGWRRIQTVEEVVRVRGRTNELLKIETTVWGPVLPDSAGGTKRAVCWVAQHREAVNFRSSELECTRDTESALRLVPLCGIPAQNFVVGDDYGTIGWTVIGRLPKRIGFDGRLPVSWADGTKRWDGLLAPEEYPRIFAPASGRLWTANNRITGDAAYLRCGAWNVFAGARARQIRDDLFALKTATPADMLAVQLDHRAVFLERWQKLLLEVLEQHPASNRADIVEMRRAVRDWSGGAAVDSVGYRLVKEFHEAVTQLILEPIIENCRRVDPHFSYVLHQQEQPVWTLLQQRPAHLLNPRFGTYADLLVVAADSVAESIRRRHVSLDSATWGERNCVHHRHPIARAVPMLERWLDLSEPMPGDDDMPRDQTPEWGVSERMVVSPGHEENGIFHMPGGQSGHFLSPYYKAGHTAWMNGQATPFLPGPVRHSLVLQPAI